MIGSTNGYLPTGVNDRQLLNRVANEAYRKGRKDRLRPVIWLLIITFCVGIWAGIGWLAWQIIP